MIKSKLYWQDRSDRYQFQIKVVHMSVKDMDPRRFANMTNDDFLRVPFDGIAHWGFKTQRALDHYKRCAGIV